MLTDNNSTLCYYIEIPFLGISHNVFNQSDFIASIGYAAFSGLMRATSFLIA